MMLCWSEGCNGATGEAGKSQSKTERKKRKKRNKKEKKGQANSGTTSRKRICLYRQNTDKITGIHLIISSIRFCNRT